MQLVWRNVTTTSLTLFSYMTSGLFQENWVRRLSEVTHMWHTAVNVWEALTGHFCAHKASHLKPICSRWNHRSVIEYHSEADGWSLVEVPGSGCRVMCQSAVSRSLIGCCFNCSPGSLESLSGPGHWASPAVISPVDGLKCELHFCVWSI